MKRFACLAALLLQSVIMPAQQFSSVPGQGRSMVVSKFGIVSTPQFLASQAGAHILEQGGNAIDAAIAANAVMGVVQPYVNGIGGDLFMVYYEAKTGKVYGLNSSGWTPKALTIDYLKAKGVTEINPIGVESIDVPGAVAGWMPCDTLRHFAVQPAARSCHLLRAEWISACRTQCALLDLQKAHGPTWLERNLRHLAGRSATGGSVHESCAGELASANRRQGPRRLLQRPHDRDYG